VIVRELSQVARDHFATDLIVTLAIGGSVALKEPLTGLVIVVMQTGGEALERYAEGRASAAVRELEAAAPRIAHRMRSGVAEDVPADVVAIGDELVIRPGELVPCDAIVLSGHSALDVSRLTGEPMPIDVSSGSLIQSGSGNGEGELTVRATAIASDVIASLNALQASRALQRVRLCPTKITDLADCGSVRRPTY
jgi:P-type E1-E2 ATPase